MGENGRTRILMVIPSFGGGGAERVGVTLINSFDEKEYDLFVITFDDRNDYFRDVKRKIDYVCLRKKSPLDFFCLVLEVRKTMLTFRPAVVISLLHYYNLIAGSASLLLKKDFKLILCEHIFLRNFLEQSRFAPIKKYMMGFLYRRADKIVAISQQMKQALIDDLGVDKNKVELIYNPIPIESIKILGKQDVKHRFFEDERNLVIISVGRLSAQKRFDRLLRGFFLLRAKRNDVYLVVLGAGSLLGELQALADQLGISKAVDFVGFQSNPYAWMTKADLFVLSSDYEGFPMVLLEAMACGLPLVSTDCPSGPKEIIEQGKNGLLVPFEDIEALANAILDILTKEGQRERMSTYALNSVEKYDHQSIFSQYERLWKT